MSTEKRRFAITKIRPIPYRNFYAHIPNHELAYLNPAFDASSAIVWQVKYRINGKEKSLCLSSPDEMAVHPLFIEQAKLGKLKIPLLEEGEFEFIRKLYALREVEFLSNNPSIAEERLSEESRWYDEVTKLTIQSYLPFNNEERIYEMSNLEKKSVVPIRRARLKTA